MRVLPIIGVLLGVGVVTATPPCHVQQIQAVQAVQYATPVLPLYTVGYQQAVDLSPLLEELRLMRQEIQQLRAPAALREEPVGLKVLRKSCAKCHTEGGAKGGLALFSAAGAFQASPESVGKVVASIHEGKMPPGPDKLSAEDRYQVLYHLAVQPVAKK